MTATAFLDFSCVLSPCSVSLFEVANRMPSRTINISVLISLFEKYLYISFRLTTYCGSHRQIPLKLNLDLPCFFPPSS